MRTADMAAIAPYYASGTAAFSLECWAARLDVAMRFLKEDPWERLAVARSHLIIPSRCCCVRPMRSRYTNYADNVVKYFVQQAAKNGTISSRVRLAQQRRQHARGDGCGD